jgi:hypothetical protein
MPETRLLGEMRYPVQMSRTFVSVELRDQSATTRFASAMNKLGFLQTVTGRKKRKELLIPSGMFLLERANARQALELTRRAVAEENVEARIFCIPAGDDIRFGNLQRH